MMAEPPAWISGLSDEDLNFIKRFVLASGSLKAVAAEYGISYPTVRMRLNRLIDKVALLDSMKQASEFERLVRGMCVDGKLDAPAMKELLSAHRREMSNGETTTEGNNA